MIRNNSGEIIVDNPYASQSHEQIRNSSYYAGGRMLYLMGEEKQKNHLLVTLVLTLGMTQTLYLNIPTFLPQYRAKHHPKINDGEIGIILA